MLVTGGHKRLPLMQMVVLTHSKLDLKKEAYYRQDSDGYRTDTLGGGIGFNLRSPLVGVAFQ